jgi:hypothetical protein
VPENLLHYQVEQEADAQLFSARARIVAGEATQSRAGFAAGGRDRFVLRSSQPA